MSSSSRLPEADGHNFTKLTLYPKWENIIAHPSNNEPLVIGGILGGLALLFLLLGSLLYYYHGRRKKSLASRQKRYARRQEKAATHGRNISPSPSAKDPKNERKSFDNADELSCLARKPEEANRPPGQIFIRLSDLPRATRESIRRAKLEAELKRKK